MKYNPYIFLKMEINNEKNNFVKTDLLYLLFLTSSSKSRETDVSISRQGFKNYDK